MIALTPRMAIEAVGIVASALAFPRPVAAAPGDPTFAPSRLLNSDAETDAVSDQSPRIATDGRTWIVGWHALRTKDGKVGTGSDTDIFYIRSLDGGGTWCDPAPLQTNADE